ETNGSAPFEVSNTMNDETVIKINDGKSTNDVLQYLLQQGVVIHSFNEVLPSLNDIFIKVVEGTAHARQFQEIKD
ncbi:MAG TPA: DUF4162 domain-containing protein, partial [Chitinophagaceae bacterium]|nr:DUF4162 domain-containing protein [Chitinophagaceae bacterium]